MSYGFPMIMLYAMEKFLRMPLACVRRIRSVLICWFWGIEKKGPVIFAGPTFIRTLRKGEIQVQGSVRFYSTKTLNPLCNAPTTIDARNGSVVIGADSGLSSVTISSRESVIIGARCLIGANTQIYDHNFHALKAEDRRDPAKRMNIKTSSVVIEDDCFIGANSVILKGSHIGRGSLVAANSVVFGLNVPPFSLVKGNPAVVSSSLSC